MPRFSKNTWMSVRRMWLFIRIFYGLYHFYVKKNLVYAFDIYQRNEKRILMEIEKTVRDAIEKYLSEKKVKNFSMLCQKAGIDQAGFGAYINTKKYQEGKGKKPARLKNDVYFGIVAKVIEAMDGQLVFPWDIESSPDSLEIKKLHEELAEKDATISAQKEKIQFLEGEIAGLLKGLSVVQSSMDKQTISYEDNRSHNSPAGKQGAA